MQVQLLCFKIHVNYLILSAYPFIPIYFPARKIIPELFRMSTVFQYSML